MPRSDRDSAPKAKPPRPSVRRAAAGRGAPWRWAAAGLALTILAIGCWWRLAPPPRPAGTATTAPPAPPAAHATPRPAAPAPSAPPEPPPEPAVLTLQTADEAAIWAHDAAQVTAFRFAAAPAIIVLDFPSLLAQGQMLNRVAALVEKAGLPHDRVLDDAGLEQAIRASGRTPATFYYGHDYKAAALAGFFTLADRDGVRLTASEERLRALLRQLGWFAPAAAGALLSVSRAGADADVTPAIRAVLLHHELSHGAFFTDARYAAYVRAFWHGALTVRERAAVREFLAASGYDSGDEELMLNEMQAYIMFTHDPAVFDPAVLGMSPARRARLEAAFHRGLPDSWVRALNPAPALPRPGRPGAISAAGCEAAAPCR